MSRLRKFAGVLVLAYRAHSTEPFVFPLSLPLVIAVLYGVSSLVIGVLLLRGSTQVLFWGAVLPLSAARQVHSYTTSCTP